MFVLVIGCCYCCNYKSCV